MHAPNDSPMRYMGLFGALQYSDLTVSSTSFTKSEHEVRSVSGICKHQTSKILHSFLWCGKSPSPTPSMPEIKSKSGECCNREAQSNGENQRGGPPSDLSICFDCWK
nr:hypothetical protein Iba_chr01aCG0170 [Ipomoea batatas]GMC48695.1 hypothetical protein Iba_chr01bCG0950 [Ipomoea batatas]GMC52776.1 hypothetical protein Iba_chr01dCG0480 [Ipomoea batatas]GMC55641.1 hypothetical protein Iba_chr01eCG9380 [Ipomoea batatas]